MCVLVNVATVVCDACHVCARIEWMLPMFDGKSFYKFLSARMRNFCCTASKTKGGRHCTIVLPMGRLFLLTMSHAFLRKSDGDG